MRQFWWVYTYFDSEHSEQHEVTIFFVLTWYNYFTTELITHIFFSGFSWMMVNRWVLKFWNHSVKVIYFLKLMKCNHRFYFLFSRAKKLTVILISRHLTVLNCTKLDTWWVWRLRTIFIFDAHIYAWAIKVLYWVRKITAYYLNCSWFSRRVSCTYIFLRRILKYHTIIASKTGRILL